MNQYKQEEIDHRNYLQSLMLVGQAGGDLSISEINQIQGQLFEVLKKVAETMDEKTLCTKTIGAETVHGLTMDQAERLLASICYQISYGLKKEPSMNDQIKKLKETEISALYQEGHEWLRIEFETEKKTYEKLKRQRLTIDNQAYEDTLVKGLGEFFDTYDMVGKAHELPGYFDYPLCAKVQEVGGLSYVKEYLEYLVQEEKFCQLFQEGTLQALLNGYSTQSRQLAVNLYEMVISNVLGCLLLNKSWNEIMDLNVKEEERNQLEQLVLENGSMELERLAYDKVNKFLIYCGTKIDKTLREYILASIPKVMYRYNKNARNHTLDQIFVTLNEGIKLESKNFIDGYPMPEEKLREVIQELKECSYTSDKLLLIRKKVRNIEDLVKILSDCVYGEEAKELFLQLSDQELAVLMDQVLKESERNNCYNYKDSMNWHMELLLAINQLDSCKNKFERRLLK